ncbi:MAG: 5'-methylthioadenosine/S-adenosylhomocysteine nucleosidase, partial [Alphaproteobacteria bacterium]
MTLDILYVMAATQEYGAHLQARITPVMTGVGPVEAAVTVAAHLAERLAAETLPHLVVSLGSAGSAVLEQGAVYQASSVSWRDMDASRLGFPR